MTYDFKAESDKIAQGLPGWIAGESEESFDKRTAAYIEHSLREAAAAAIKIGIESIQDNADDADDAGVREAPGLYEAITILKIIAASLREGGK